MKFDLYQREGALYYVLVYPDKRLAKVYKNKDSGFKKLGDYSVESVKFNVGKRDFYIDFGMVWR